MTFFRINTTLALLIVCTRFWSPGDLPYILLVCLENLKLFVDLQLD